MPRRLSCCCRIRARGSPSLHTRARQQRAKKRRLLRAVGGKQKRAARAAAILRSHHGSDPLMSWTCGGCGRRAATIEETATKGVAADRDPLEQTSRVHPSSGTARAAPWATSEPIGAQSLRESVAHRGHGDVGSGRGGQGPRQLSDADEWW